MSPRYEGVNIQRSNWNIHCVEQDHFTAGAAAAAGVYNKQADTPVYF